MTSPYVNLLRSNFLNLLPLGARVPCGSVTSHLVPVRSILWHQPQCRMYHFEYAKRMYPHPSKVDKGGEDASFCTAQYLGVADGVGSWTEVGIDPGLYSRELLFRIQCELGIKSASDDATFTSPQASSSSSDKSAKSLVRSSTHIEPYLPLPVLSRAFNSMKSQGSSTVCLVFLDQTLNLIKSANIGDSGFIIFRPSTGKIVGRSICQQHEHNFPYQLGPSSTDRPEDAELSTFSVQPGDWVVLATDGLWDNVYDSQITTCLEQSKTASDAVDKISGLAHKLSLDDFWNSPFCEKEIRFQLYVTLGLQNDDLEEGTEALVQKAVDAGINSHLLRAITRIKGGKPDDISVVVGIIRDGAAKGMQKM